MTGGIKGIHHIALSVPNLEEARAFYVGVLGFKEGVQGNWKKGNDIVDAVMDLKDSSGRSLLVRAGNIYLELFEYLTPTPAPLEPNRPVCNYGYIHMAFDVEDIESVHRRLAAAGMKFHTAPKTAYGVTTTYGRDPFGNVIELQEIHDSRYVKPLDA